MISFYKKIIKILKRPNSLNIGFIVFENFGKNILNIGKKNILFALRPGKIRYNKLLSEQIADPFLMVLGEFLYCFFEEKSRKDPGKIKVLIYSKDGKISKNKCDLGEKSHMSFPFIFLENSSCYMIPETAAIKEVSIYKPISFPYKWKKQTILLRGNFVDSHILFNEGVYYLFTTEKVEIQDSKYFEYNLCLFTSSFLDRGYVSHPCNPISIGRKYSRSGGSIINQNGNLYRIAQDCLDSYGNDLNIFKITMISKTEYKEELVSENWVRNQLGFSSGGHHLSICKWDNHDYIAVDVNLKDSYFQRFVKPFLK